LELAFKIEYIFFIAMIIKIKRKTAELPKKLLLFFFIMIKQLNILYKFIHKLNTQLFLMLFPKFYKRIISSKESPMFIAPSSHST